MLLADMQGVHGFQNQGCQQLVAEVLEDGIFALQDALQAVQPQQSEQQPDKTDILRALAAAEIIAALLQHNTKHVPADPELCEWIHDYGYVELAPLPEQALAVVQQGLDNYWQHHCAVSKQGKKRWLGKMQRLAQALASHGQSSVLGEPS